jgi:hypothetical protein
MNSLVAAYKVFTQKEVNTYFSIQPFLHTMMFQEIAEYMYAVEFTVLSTRYVALSLKSFYRCCTIIWIINRLTRLRLMSWASGQFVVRADDEFFIIIRMSRLNFCRKLTISFDSVGQDEDVSGGDLVDDGTHDETELKLL